MDKLDFISKTTLSEKIKDTALRHWKASDSMKNNVDTVGAEVEARIASALFELSAIIRDS